MCRTRYAIVEIRKVNFSRKIGCILSLMKIFQSFSYHHHIQLKPCPQQLRLGCCPPQSPSYEFKQLSFWSLFTRSRLRKPKAKNGQKKVSLENFNLCGPNFVWSQYQDLIYFHRQNLNHWTIYSYFGYIRHHTQITLLLFCDNIKDWSLKMSHI